MTTPAAAPASSATAAQPAASGTANAQGITTGTAYQNVTVPPAQQSQGTSASASTTAPAGQPAPADTSQSAIASFFSTGPGSAQMYSPSGGPAVTAQAAPQVTASQSQSTAKTGSTT